MYKSMVQSNKVYGGALQYVNNKFPIQIPPAQKLAYLSSKKTGVIIVSRTDCT